MQGEKRCAYLYQVNDTCNAMEEPLNYIYEIRYIHIYSIAEGKNHISFWLTNHLHAVQIESLS